MVTNDDTGLPVPANSQVVPGPITIDGNLTITGSETVGSLVVTGNAAVGSFTLGGVPITASGADINGVQSALALKAPLASPALTGTPTAPTAAAETNTAQIATTAFVIGEGYWKRYTDINVRDAPYSAVGDGTADDTTAIQAACSSGAGTGFITVYIPAGSYKLTSLVTVPPRVRVIGAGKYATKIVGTGGFNFINGVAINAQSEIGEIGFSSADTTTQKFAIRATDTSELYIHDIAIGPIGAWTGAGSIGIQTRGRDLCHIARCNIAADFPIKVERNPNLLDGLEDMDVSHWQDLQLISGAGNYAVTFIDGAQCTDLVWDGSNDCSGGKGILFYSNTVGTQTSFGLTLRNIRSENSSAGNIVSFTGGSVAGAHLGVTLDNVSGGLGNGGFLISGATHVTMLGCRYYGTGVSLQVSNLVSLNLINNRWGSSTRTMTGMRRVFGTVRAITSATPGFMNEIWESDTNTNVTFASHYFGGGLTGENSGIFLSVQSDPTLANNGVVSIAAIPASAVLIDFFCVGATKSEKGSVLVTNVGGGTFVQIDGTANFATTAGAGKIAIADGGSGLSTIRINNQLGETVKYGFMARWITT